MTEPIESTPLYKTNRFYQRICLVLAVSFFIMHMVRLNQKPLHHDEGVNGNFMKNLVVDNNWKYDPKNYHGPTLYYFQLIPTWINGVFKDGVFKFRFHSLSGLTPVSVRVAVAFIGFLVVLGMLFAYPILGPWGALTAFLLAGFSADFLYYSRYFIHETYVILFTLGIYLSVVYYVKLRKKIFFYLFVISSTLLFCTKETSLITFIILLLAYLFTEITLWALPAGAATPPYKPVYSYFSSFGKELKDDLLKGAVVALILWIIFFTSFFTNWKGPLDSFRAYIFWGKEGLESGHVKPFLYYISDILIRYELAALVLGTVGMVLAFLRNDRRGLFLTYWSLGIIGFYSIVPYKTPWLVLNLLLPLFLISGFGIQTLMEMISESKIPIRKKTAKGIIMAFASIPFFIQLPQAMRVVYKEYDYDRHPQPYVHTSRQIFGLIDKIEEIANRPGGDKYLNINVFTEKYWPIPFYLREYPHVHYYGKYEGVRPLDADIIIVDADKKDALSKQLTDTYNTRTYSLRSGVPLVLFINNKVLPGSAQAAQIIDLLSAQNLKTQPAPGLRKEVYKGADFAGAPISISDSDVSFDFTWLEDKDKAFQSPFSMRWTGYIEIKESGVYKFSLESDDGSWLIVDDKLVVDNGGEHPTIRSSGRANLSTGYHKIEMKYFDIGGGAVFKALWTPPNKKEETLPANLLAH